MMPWLKKWLRRICVVFLNRLDGGASAPIEPTGPADEPKAERAYRIPTEEDADPLRQAYANLFSPRRAEEEEVHFRPVRPDGIFVARIREWKRIGNTIVARGASMVVVTCSGAISNPESLKAVCWTCRGYEAVLIRCSACSKTLCHLHACRFVLPDGTAVMLCEEHRRQAERSYDTWAAQDHARQQAGRAKE